MASLANQTISSTYDGLIKTSTDQPVGVSGVQLLEDGVGNSLALSVGRANQGVTVTGTLTATTVTGTLSATSVLADGVIATTQATSDNSTKVATTAFVKSVVTAEDLDIAGDSGTGAVDLDSQTLTIEGTANEIETSASGQTITIGLPSTITANVTGNVSGNVTGDLTGTVLTAAQTNITSVGTLSSLAVSGNLTVDTNTLFVDASNNFVGIGTSSPAAKLDVVGTNRFQLRTDDTVPELRATTADGTAFKELGLNGLQLIFNTSSAEAARFNTSGNLVFPNGKGIDFSATAGGGATSSLLDDYEEGTFTFALEPNISGTITLDGSFTTGQYTKIGRQVTVTGLAVISSVASPVGSAVALTGLPFTRAAGASNYGVSALNYYDSPSYLASQVSNLGALGGTRINIIKDASTFAVDDELGFTYTYFV